jgi:small subunit ribosomal protein S1
MSDAELNPYAQTPMDPEEYERLLDMYDVSFKNLAEGEVVRGIVLRVTPMMIVVDVGYKSEGVIAAEEFKDETGQVTVKPGDQVDVLIERTEDRDGYIVLSREKAEKMKVWDDVERAYQERRIITGKVLDRVKGGLAVDIGVRAFLPGSQIDIRPVRNLDALKGQDIRMRVIKVNKKRGNIVLSRKAVLEEENAGKKQQTLEVLEEGKILTGVVKNITDYGAFVDLGGLDGLLHITDMSWGRINDPKEVVNVGDELRVIVLKFDRDAERVSLGLKQLKADPWTTVALKYPVGARVKGKVVSLTDYGAFIELEQGWKASSTSPRCRGRRSSSIRASSSPSARKSSARFWASTRKRTAFPSASSRPRRIRGSSSTASIPWAPRSRARSATSPSSARSSKSRTVSTASSTCPT